MIPNLQFLGIDQLSIAQRLELIDAIWETIPPDVAMSDEGDIPEWHKEVVVDRLKTLDPAKLLTWEEFFTDDEK